MAHPYQKSREHKVSHDRVKTIMKADGGAASFDERYPRGVWSGGKGPSIDSAFTGENVSKTEFALGRALKEKAKKMEK